MINKKLLYTFIFILIIFIFNGCTPKFNTDLLIISSPDNKVINYSKYNSNKKIQEKIYSTNKTCYPTAVLSYDANTLYFTKSDKYGLAQLFERNLNTKKEKQLTFQKDNKIINVDFLKINYSKNIIYLRIVQENHRNFNLAIYNINSNELKILDENEYDLSDQFFDFNNISKSILIFQNSIKEEFNLMDKANKTKNFNISPNYDILLKDESGEKQNTYGSIENNIVDVSISPDNKSALILTGQIVDLSKHEFKKSILLKDLNNIDKNEIILNNLESYNDITKICFSKDGKGFYFIATESKDKSQNYNLYYYNLKNQESSQILKFDNEDIFDCIPIYK
ncbi:translocation protein TolB [Clostridioides difficile]|nr:translocation protein TolB [Clostridioides difficile]